MQDIEKHTPMMKQYLEIKHNYPDTLVFYRMGDFYELFFDDATTAAKLLGITVTTRGNSNGQPIKMAGVPFHALEPYLLKLVKLEQSVVIVDQVGEVTGKGPVERKVTRIITPGTLVEASLLNDKEDNLICCVYLDKGDCAIATMSVSTGVFLVNQVRESELINQLERISPNELLVQEELRDKFAKLKLRYSLKPLAKWHFDFNTAYRKLCSNFRLTDLSSFGITPQDRLIIVSANALLEYVRQTQCSDLPHIQKISLERDYNGLELDAISRRNLEINYTISGQKSPTLLSVLDGCVTVMGSRKLRLWLNNPLASHEQIRSRQQVVSCLINKTDKLNQILSGICDIERISARIALGSARPRDLAALRDSLTILPQLYYLREFDNSLINQLLSSISGVAEELAILLSNAIKPEPSALIRDGGVINAGYNEQLDHLRDMQVNANKYLEELTLSEQNRVNIPNLRIEYNRVHGYYIEISNSHLNKVPNNYRRTQTLKNAERFTTDELKQFETEVLTALDNSLELEKDLYNQILLELNDYISQLQQIANAVATLDVLNNFAVVAGQNNYVCPQLVESNIINIEGGRHPVIERQVEQFIANDVNLSDNSRFLLITGPNMGGKSTYMRQIALIVLLSYCGSFVPATSATIGVVDRIFTRIGASDDLSLGKSTFMVEMSETANILNNATPKSLILLDEVGRGTSTYDGLSLAYSISRFLIEKIGAYTLFATHYFELTNLIASYANAKNIHLSAVEQDDLIVFLHHVYEGAAEKSYGIQVAKLAGVPKVVINMAQKYLQNLEAAKNNNQLDIFSQLEVEESTVSDDKTTLLTANELAVIEEVNEINPDNLTAKEALDFIYNLKRKL